MRKTKDQKELSLGAAPFLPSGLAFYEGSAPFVKLRLGTHLFEEYFRFALTSKIVSLNFAVGKS